jgi:hypothetical protein
MLRIATLVSSSTVAAHAEEPEAKGFLVSGPDGSELVITSMCQLPAGNKIAVEKVSRGAKKKIYLKLS